VVIELFMIHVLIGTRAQLIKMAPVILEIERRGIGVNLVMTGQHQETMAALLQDFGVAAAPVWLHTGREISGLGQVIPWFSQCLWRLTSRASPLANGQRGDPILVHGDTFSTLLGALAGRMRGLCVAHVESGLRSFNVLHPFPEELTRLAVFRLAEIAFCPDALSQANLKKYRLRAINTQGNTLLDALRIALHMQRPLPQPLPEGKFGVVSLHRFENIFSRKRLAAILDLLEEVAARYPLVFVLHPATRRNLTRYRYMPKLTENARFHLWPRMGYFEFVTLLGGSAFVITDGGSNQEELSYLGKPTLLMRRATERQDGLGTHVTLSNYERAKVLAFMDSVEQQSSAEGAVLLDAMPSPSAIIVDILAALIGTNA
jgi:UDP-N-acetylglucosamine 2-epimerase (non-hydrolysing)